jgi:hypothetical protein
MTSTRTAEIYAREGIVVAKILPGVTQHLPDAEENYAAVVKLAGSVTCPLLIDMRAAAPLMVEARHFYASKKMDDRFTALGLLLNASPVGRMIGNVYFQIARHRVPVRLFTEEELAWNWLISSKK